MILSRLIAFTWKACFSRIKLIYTTIIRSIIIYDFTIWHESHERLNNVVVATKKLIKLQQQNLRLINDNFKTISTQILETKTHVQLIQLHMTRLQIFFKQCIKEHKHDVLIENFCRQIKHRLFETRRRRRRKAEKTSITRKIKWTQTMHDNLSADERENVVFSNKILIKLFLKNEEICETHIKRKIDAKSAKRWWKISRQKKWNCTKTWSNRKVLSLFIWKRDV